MEGGGWGRAEAWPGPEAPCLGSPSALGLSRRGNPARGPCSKELQRTPTHRTGASSRHRRAHLYCKVLPCGSTKNHARLVLPAGTVPREGDTCTVSQVTGEGGCGIQQAPTVLQALCRVLDTFTLLNPWNSVF